MYFHAASPLLLPSFCAEAAVEFEELPVPATRDPRKKANRRDSVRLYLPDLEMGRVRSQGQPLAGRFLLRRCRILVTLCAFFWPVTTVLQEIVNFVFTVPCVSHSQTHIQTCAEVLHPTLPVIPFPAGQSAPAKMSMCTDAEITGRSEVYAHVAGGSRSSLNRYSATRWGLPCMMIAFLYSTITTNKMFAGARRIGMLLTCRTASISPPANRRGWQVGWFYLADIARKMFREFTQTMVISNNAKGRWAIVIIVSGRKEKL